MDAETKRLYKLLKAHGIVNPLWTILAARKAGLGLPRACALLEKESGKGQNEFGHDDTIFVGAGIVTRVKYAAYKKLRIASGNRLMQGVGPCQLTWYSTQDAADQLGGCYKPLANMIVGFTAMQRLIEKYGERAGAAAYNGSGPAAVEYGKDFVEKASRWKAVLAA